MRYRYLTLPILLGYLLCAPNAQAQTPAVIEVDSATNTVKSTIPFDRPFTLKIRAEEKPTEIRYFAGKKIRTWDGVLRTQLARSNSGSAKCKKLEASIKALEDSLDVLQARDTVRINAVQAALDSLYSRSEKKGCSPDFPGAFHPERISFATEAGKGFVYMRFDQAGFCPEGSKDCIKSDLIKPNRNLIVFFHKPREVGFDVIRLMHDGKRKEAIALNDSLRKAQEMELGFIYLLPQYGKDLDRLLAKTKKQFIMLDDEGKAIKSRSEEKYDLMYAGLLDQLIAASLTDTLPGVEDCLLDCDLTKAFLALREMDAAALATLLRGERTVMDPKLKKKDADLTANLKATSTLLERMVNYQRAREVITARPYVNPDMVRLRDAARANITSLGKRADARKEIMQIIGPSYVEVQQVTGTSAVYNFKTRSAFRIIPDFGLIAYGFQFQNDFTRLSPYLGVQLSVRQLDKDIPFNLYPHKSILHRLSFSLGYSISAVAEEGKREDFFEKGSLLTGMGVRLSHGVRLTGGTMWFYRNSPNPALQERALNFAPYFGVSFDLDIRELVNGFDKLTIKK